MQKPSGEKAVTDKENARVFADHFAKLFNNPSLPPCDDTVLPFVPQRDMIHHLADPPTREE
eukprot:9649090-Ditylum_brightwellii.AAC.1